MKDASKVVSFKRDVVPGTANIRADLSKQKATKLATFGVALL